MDKPQGQTAVAPGGKEQEGKQGKQGKQPTGYSSLLVSVQNAALQTIPLPERRIEELPTELNQFFAAALANRARLDFDTEPASFIVSLARGRKEGA